MTRGNCSSGHAQLEREEAILGGSQARCGQHGGELGPENTDKVARVGSNLLE